LEGVKVDKQLIRKGLENAARIAGAVPAVILEHHLLRSEDWKDRAKVVFQAADQKHHTVTTGAESGGIKLQLLEATRSRLYEEDPPSDEFLKWCKMRREKQRTQPPPV
jgi:predicted metallo-beta-lactamase superfamily hydrolase